ncbi:hypothetical protein PUNSTDRAFT_135078 [Punctularia strigosozonata HHB-11173 SS5]|uniref:uncharacterized protein n=1 Tax=Punctularia strigosozonata (strain HHB-11173) TaxID=741275 RepID=UPI000441816F|nr:uncharacterized protein PUNSTDRAFT_135078 [Punctularia strigosozonata HHB-11173 SS5]EIN07552.1 hypothetical protein PUNSTDRAFT_135078 [Punctularia strigosozonata HHB-11173 SS5]
MSVVPIAGPHTKDAAHEVPFFTAPTPARLDLEMMAPFHVPQFFDPRAIINNATSAVQSAVISVAAGKADSPMYEKTGAVVAQAAVPLYLVDAPGHLEKGFEGVAKAGGRAMIEIQLVARKLPSLPKFKKPSLPKVKAPSLPQVHFPSPPKIKLPSPPKIELPSFPKVHMPHIQIPKIHLPSLPHVKLPTIHAKAWLAGASSILATGAKIADWTAKNKTAIAGVIGGTVTAAIGLPLLIVGGLHVVGFTAGGVAAGKLVGLAKNSRVELSPNVFFFWLRRTLGSLAAAIQGTMGGLVAAGSPFAIAQWIGAVGVGAVFGPVAGAVLVGGVLVGGIVLLKKYFF